MGLDFLNILLHLMETLEVRHRHPPGLSKAKDKSVKYWISTLSVHSFAILFYCFSVYSKPLLCHDCCAYYSLCSWLEACPLHTWKLTWWARYFMYLLFTSLVFILRLNIPHKHGFCTNLSLQVFHCTVHHLLLHAFLRIGPAELRKT